EDNARNAEAAYKDARALEEKVKARPQSPANEALLKQIDAIAPVEAEPAGGRGGRGGRGGGGGFGGGRGAAAEPPPPPTLANIGQENVAAAQSMQGSEMPPTAAE